MENEDQELYREAKKRVEFKSHLVSYLLVNAFLWIIWILGSGGFNSGYIPWPVYCTVGWGIGLGSHYFSAYHGSPNMVQKEYEKLKQKHNK